VLGSRFPPFNVLETRRDTALDPSVFRERVPEVGREAVKAADEIKRLLA
jgi:hypothetical protein